MKPTIVRNARGKLYFSSWLKANGYSNQLVKQILVSGWLTMLSKGLLNHYP
ncbi:MAG: AbiEi antitoxin N-terminal domain-containing protein [Proteocatella sp.]